MRRHPLLVTLLVAVLRGVGAYAQDATVEITSPQGRLSSSGPIRIVARATAATGTAVEKVTFYAGDTRIGEDVSGPIFAVEWVDDNPFVPIELRAEAVDSTGRVAEHRLSLPALDITDETSVASVLLDVAVLDEDGRYVAGLTRERFALREEDVPQKIELAEPSRAPTTITLLVDTSQSMSSRFDFVRRALRRLASLLRPDDTLAVAPFARSLGAITGPTRDLDALSSAIEGLHTRGGTAIADALGDLASRIKNAPGRQIVVLITDGYDEHSTTDVEQSVGALRRASATLYTVGIGGVAGMSFRGRDVLKQLAQQTGGKAFFPARDAELPLVQEHIQDDVAHRYLLTYTPANQTHDGKWRAITLTTDIATYAVKTRAGYFAPAPAPIKPVIEFTAVSRASDSVMLGRYDLEVREDGVLQAVESFQEAVAPVSILIALDQSGSMRGTEAEVRSAALSFVDAVRDEDRIGIVTFSDDASMITDLTLSRAIPRQSIASYRTSGGTALLDGIAISLDRLATSEGRKAIVVMTDGRDENAAGTGPGSRRTLARVLDQIREVDAAIFAIGLGPNVDRASLERLAQTSGGAAYFPAAASELGEQYTRVVEDLRRRYVLSYVSTNSARDGRWRQVTLQGRAGDVVVRSRGGYRAPEQ
ncbi:VWFA-related Acidobacterial domain protein [Luteitalea pratensis]|uniref:VWFA-related Acidobacterial domain protein n=1 Tax=Luteitalea pratensis TaxID=1855912 RepID=A0A143PWS3_LUTPR|nr:VWA domain-containing protein [Luteitalea pratensis]AMY12274.1 VWFA-related Acidobacterial domain protein [Luteitalea pratensis]